MTWCQLSKQAEEVPLPHGGKWTCVHVPVQADGTLPDGRNWYFRARGGGWTLSVSEEPGGDPVRLFQDQITAPGADPWSGWMPLDVAAGLIAAVLETEVREL